MEFFADYHMHSKYSDGRYTIEEMAASAKEKGLKEIAITDHGPKNLGVGVKSLEKYLEVKKEVNALSTEDFKVLSGAEANVISLEGDLDIPKDISKELDIFLVGLHPYVLPQDAKTAVNFVLMNGVKHVNSFYDKAINTNTKALVEAMHKNDVDIVTHPGLGMPVDIKEVAKACVATDTLFEINVGHKYQSVADVVLAFNEGVNFVVNSDAHFLDSVGDLSFGSEILEQAKVPVERVYNAIKT